MRTDIELLRIISAFGVVWYHAGTSYARDVAYAGLVVFLVLSAYFAGVSNKRYSVFDRAKRLLIPCVLWSAFFAVITLSRGLELYPESYSLFSKVLSTPAIHLWYLPFVFISIVCIDQLKRWVPSVYLASASSVGASILLLSSPEWRQWDLIAPLSQYIHACTAVLIGLFFSQRIQNKATAVALSVLLFVSTVYVYSLKVHDVSTTYLVGLLASSILLFKRDLIPSIPFVYKVSSLMFGVYLLHPFVLLCASFLGLSGNIVPVVGFVASTIIVYLMSMTLPPWVKRHVI